MTLRKRILLMSLSIGVTSIICVYLLVLINQRKAFNEVANENTSNLLEIAMLTIENEYNSLIFHKNTLSEQRKIERKNIIGTAKSFIYEYYNNSKSGVISEEEAKQLAIQSIKNFRYDNGNGYIWINNTEKPAPRMIVHPILSELNNTILSDSSYYSTPGSKNLFSVGVEVCESQGGGFIEYLWSKPTNENLINNRAKISYVEIFSPWQWVLGTGIYLEDIEEDAKKRLDAILVELQQTIGEMKIAESGYFLIFNSKKEVLLHPDLAGQVLDSTSYLANISPIDQIIEASKRNKKTYHYKWKFPQSNKEKYTQNKTAFIEYFEPLDWYVCATIVKEEIEKPATDLGNKLLLIIISILIISIFASVQLSNSLSRPIRKLLKYVSIIPSFDQQIDERTIPISGSKETRLLGKAIKEMLISLQKQRLSLVEAMQKTKESEEKYRFLVENSPTIFWIIDSKGTPRYLSPNFHKVMGYNPEEVESEGIDFWRKIIHPQDLENVMTHIDSLFNEGKRIDLIYRIRQKSGEWIWIHYLGEQNFELFGKDVAYGVAIDINKEKLSEQQIYQAIIQSEEKERSRIAKDLHDGVSPLLSAIKLFIQSKQSSKDEKIRLELSNKIVTTIEEAIQSINEISANISPHILQNFGLLSAIESFAVNITEHRDISFSIDSNLNERLPNGIETTLYRISTELMNNTIKYALAQKINIDCIIDGNELTLKYNDNGIGFDVENTLKNNKGMGLFNMKNRVDSLNGKFEITSNENEGISVNITIPLN
jgi:PAS domain S-box-containing protein